jgi:hypothetical protein
VIKRLAIFLLLAGSACPGFSQQAPPPEQNANALKQFTRSGKFNDITLFFVHMNNRTVEALFQAPTKYSMRARANMATMLYVQGTPDKDGNLTTTFTLEQDGQTTPGTIHNIKNFKEGAVVKGERIDGIIQFEKKVDLSHAFTISNGETSVEFNLAPDALKLLEAPQQP